MQRPICKICGHEHYASEAHIWAGRDFNFLPPGSPVTPPPSFPVTGYVSVASKKSQIEQRSRYRSPEAAAAYRKYKREYMAKRRAGVYDAGEGDG